MWAISSSFGPHTPEQWLALSQPMLKPVPNPQGGTAFVLHYDPAIALPFGSTTEQQAKDGEALLWQAYDAISARTLLLRGAQSDLLSAATAQQMTQRGPQAQLVEFAGVGHAPTLIASDQVDTVANFVLAA
jgi:pimeloyl-ACP methyl ester carboxylesterase